jgi:rhodanese-related sulfurtransferase
MTMTLTVQQMLAEANAAVPRIDAAAAQALIAQRGALLLDIRDAPELEKMGRAEGSHHIPRGMLEFRADPASPFHDPALRKDRPVVLHCASGGRAALAGKLLRDMGYAEVWNLGGLKDWKDGGGPVVEPVDQGM